MRSGTVWSRCCRSVSAGFGIQVASRRRTGRCLRDLVRAAHRDPAGVPAQGPLIRVGHDLLAQAAGLEQGRRLAAVAPTAGRTERACTSGLVPLSSRLLARQGARRGEHTGPSPADRGRAGSKHHLITDGHGILHDAGLGTHRWGVERSFAWLHGLRRLSIRWERRADIHESFLAAHTLAQVTPSPAGLVTFYENIGDVTGADVGNGYFLDPTSDLLLRLQEYGGVDVGTDQKADDLAIGSNGGDLIYGAGPDEAAHRTRSASRTNRSSTRWPRPPALSGAAGAPPDKVQRQR